MHNCDDEKILKDIDDFIEEDIDGEQVLRKKRSILFDLIGSIIFLDII